MKASRLKAISLSNRITSTYADMTQYTLAFPWDARYQQLHDQPLVAKNQLWAQSQQLIYLFLLESIHSICFSQYFYYGIMIEGFFFLTFWIYQVGGGNTGVPFQHNVGNVTIILYEIEIVCEV